VILSENDKSVRATDLVWGIHRIVVLDDLERTSSIATLLELMCGAAEFRDRARVGELRARGQALALTNQPRAERLALIAAELERIHDCLDAAPGEGTVASLNAWLKLHPHGGWPGMRRLALRLCSDARARGDHATRRRLIGTLHAYRTLDHFTRSLTGKSPWEVADAVFEQTAMPAHDFIAWLAIRGQGPDEHAQIALQMHEFLADLQRTRTPIQSDGLPGEQRRLKTHDEAERWIEEMPALANQCIRAIADEGDPERWPNLVARVVAWTIASYKPAPEMQDRAAHEQAATVVATAVLCEVALRNGQHALIPLVLTTYRDLVAGDACARLPVPVRETYAYYYIYALARAWEGLRDPKPELRAAVALGESVLAGTERRRTRLIRDLHFACARLYERLGEWDRAQYERACDHYRRGLEVSELAHELEPRGRALFDLANTLHRSGLGTNDEVSALFEHALRLLPSAHSTSHVALVRLNYAIFLFERLGTTEAKARALALLEEAERAYERVAPRLSGTPWGHEILVSIWMTRANIRRDDDDATGLLEALAIYERTERELPDHPRLRLVRCNLALNRCQTYLELHRDASDLEAAQAAARTAAELALDDAARADARMYEAIASRAAGKPLDEMLAVINDSFVTSRGAGGLVRSLAAMAWRARFGVATGRTSELEEARRLFRAGHDAAARANLVFDQLQHGRGFADASVRQWEQTGSLALLDEAIAVLADVAAALEARLESDVLLVDPDNAHALLAAVAADLTWLRATTGQPVELVLRDATLAKGPDINGELLLNIMMAELPAHAASELGQARRDDWQIRRRVIARGKLDREIVDDVAALRASADRRALAIGRKRRAMVERAIDLTSLRPERGALVDITVAQWGSVVVVIRASGDPVIARAPFRLTTLERLQDRWLEAYRPQDVEAGRTAPRDLELAVTRPALREAIEQMLDAVARDLLDEVIDVLADEERLVWIPHLLAGVPLHAVRCHGGARLLETVSALGYASSIAAAPALPRTPKWGAAKVLCLAIDPGTERELAAVCREVAVVAELLLDAGATVTVVAETGGASGRAAFARRSVTLDARATCDPVASPESWLIANLSAFDHVLIASHGGYGRAGGILVMPSTTVSIADLLSTSGLSAGCTVHLNACETAMRLGRMYSLAGGLFQLGAGLVIGTGWTVRDVDALAISTALYDAVAHGQAWEQAAVRAMRGLRGELGDDSVERWSPFLVMIG
jgi:hypothetical protein